MTFLDLWLSVCSIGLVITSLPLLLNSKAQNPRFWSFAIAVILSLMTPVFYLQSFYLTMVTLSGQALVWYLIAIFRPIRKEPVKQ